MDVATWDYKLINDKMEASGITREINCIIIVIVMPR